MEIIVADDNHSMLALARRVLTPEFQVTVALTTNEALSLVEEDPLRYSVILSDLWIPDGGGLQLLRAVRQCAPWIARLIMSGDMRVKDEVLLSEAKPFRSILKPFSNQEILAAVRQAAGHRESVSSNLEAFSLAH